MNNTLQIEKCRLCGSDSFKKYEGNMMGFKNIDYFLCPECGFMQTENPTWLDKAYEKAINDSDKGLLKRNLKFSEYASKIISLFFDKNGKFLDYGGGYGVFAGLMREKGYDFYLYEPYAENLFVKDYSYNFEKPEKFELITSFEVFEHMVNPDKEIDKIFSVTKNLLFSTEVLPADIPDPKYWPVSWAYYGLEHGQHIAFYQLKTLKKIAYDRNLNFYTNGFNLHLITEKEINTSVFTEFSRDIKSDKWSYERLSAGSKQSYKRRLKSGFFEKYLRGVVLDIGYRGYEKEHTVPVLPNAIGIDKDYPGYDGKKLPFNDESVDAVYASHVLEHIEDYKSTLKEWFRVIKTGGFMVISVPHMYLYEKRRHLPSRWNADHKRFYTPSSLLREIEESLKPNSYRIRHLIDNDEGFDYSIDPFTHSGGGYEIELVIEKIEKPEWSIEEGYEFRYGDTFINTKKIIDRIYEFRNTDIRELINDRNKSLLFISKMVGLLEELYKLKHHYTSIDNELTDKLKMLMVYIYEYTESGIINDKIYDVFDMLKPDFEILEKRLSA